MEQEFADVIDRAFGIATSGRWSALSAEIGRLATKPNDNAWHIKLLGSLCSKVFAEYTLMSRAYAEKEKWDPALFAWRARNLLELLVWSMYCAKGSGHARRLYEDASRDVFDAFSAFQKRGIEGIAVAQRLDRSSVSELFRATETVKQEFTGRAAKDGFTDFKEPIKKVSAAAGECGIESHFLFSYKFLSKFAHPTAMQILVPPDDAQHVLQRDYFFSQGCLSFIGAVTALELCLAAL
ncbi:MAG TPA: DUF5677 domain-containing protein [Bryobacteraceae bacterium]|jgi:hypothetical protein